MLSSCSINLSICFYLVPQPFVVVQMTFMKSLLWSFHIHVYSEHFRTSLFCFFSGSCEWNLHYFGHLRAQQTPTSFAERTEAAGPSCSLPIALVEVLQGIWRDALARDMAAVVKSGFWWFIRCEEKIGKKQYEAAGNISAKGISKTAARDGGKTLEFTQCFLQSLQLHCSNTACSMLEPARNHEVWE